MEAARTCRKRPLFFTPTAPPRRSNDSCHATAGPPRASTRSAHRTSCLSSSSDEIDHASDEGPGSSPIAATVTSDRNKAARDRDRNKAARDRCDSYGCPRNVKLAGRALPASQNEATEKVAALEQNEQKMLPVRELNPGHPRDRRVY
ncbi:hypothetical protein PHYPSEUDO_010383 [Phytophthora pseudosyringae]|uniref:Uncharacterized protein n=1 Tax=Phytophthora pseudosyringae TaxID=221518 RepID=A0A8T1VDK6_9STRA|nr:hypothetical protein PHYPSEUDO_010383 [Phytophthora pseudosyringae]